MTPRFEKAYNALYNAFMNSTLAKGTCKACAVGNIVANAMGVSVTSKYDCEVDNTFWNGIFYTTTAGEQIIRRNGINTDCEKRLKELTEYSWEEMAKVEYAFERSAKIHYCHYGLHTPQEIMEDQFNGLMAVMDVLIELDEVKEGNSYKETFKNKFQTV